MFIVDQNMNIGSMHFKDAANRSWACPANGHYFNLKDSNDNSNICHITDLIDSKCLDRISLCPGDALIMPKWQLHAMSSSPDSVMLSIAF